MAASGIFGLFCRRFRAPSCAIIFARRSGRLCRASRERGPAFINTCARIASRIKDGARNMAHVITEPCIGTKDTACVEVCPVD